jgi:hypothetical protein
MGNWADGEAAKGGGFWAMRQAGFWLRAVLAPSQSSRVVRFRVLARSARAVSRVFLARTCSRAPASSSRILAGEIANTRAVRASEGPARSSRACPLRPHRPHRLKRRQHTHRLTGRNGWLPKNKASPPRWTRCALTLSSLHRRSLHTSGIACGMATILPSARITVACCFCKSNCWP